MDGADPATVRAAIEHGDPLPGTGGFAGAVDGALVRDVLGRRPLFYDPGAADPVAADAWGYRHDELGDPTPVPAAHAVDETGVRELWTLPSPPPAESASATRQLQTAIDRTLEAVDSEALGIAFSGGVDSALLAARLDAPLYVAGFPESHDIAAARSAADAMEAPLTVIEIDHDTLAATVPRVARATGRTNAMDVAIALPLFLTAERAAADGLEGLAVGQGADELFGGYAKVANAPADDRLAATTIRGARREVLTAIPSQLERDVQAIRAGGPEPVAPYLRDRVVRAALALPADSLVDADGTRKVALRTAADEHLPATIAAREKKAMQYGSLVARELDRLARQAGFKRRQGDHVARYVASLVG